MDRWEVQPVGLAPLSDAIEWLLDHYLPSLPHHRVISFFCVDNIERLTCIRRHCALLLLCCAVHLRNLLSGVWHEWIYLCLAVIVVGVVLGIFLNDFYFFHYRWFTVWCQFLLHCKVTQSYKYVYINTSRFSHYLPSCSNPRDQTQFPVLYSRMETMA